MQKTITWRILSLLWLLPAPTAQAQPPGYPDAAYTEHFRKETGWQAGDGTISVPLPDGRTIWLFGDSYVDMAYDASDTSLHCQFNRNNAMVIQQASDDSDLTYQVTFLPATAGHLYWPGKGFYHDGKVYIFLFERSATAFIQSVYAELSYPALALLAINPVPNPEAIQFGKAAFIEGNWLYVYGNKPYPAFGSNRYYVSRCAAGSLMQSWEYWNGSAWSMAPNANNQLMPTGTGGTSFSAFQQHSTYYILSQENGYLTCGLGQDINLYSTSLPTGPFTLLETIYTVDYTYNGIPLATYNAQAHPGVGSGDLLVSYNVLDVNSPTSGCPRQCDTGTRRNADTYRPKFVRLPASVLPVQWLYTAAVAQDEQVNIAWATATETQNSHFEVERSKDGSAFERIGQVAGAGHSSQQRHYQHADPTPHAGSSYYRVKQVDRDGQSTYSRTMPVVLPGEPAGQATIFPNPAAAAGPLHIQLPNVPTQAVEVQIYDAAGKRCFAARYTALQDTRITVQAPALPPGLYAVHLIQDRKSEILKWIVME